MVTTCALLFWIKVLFVSRFDLGLFTLVLGCWFNALMLFCLRLAVAGGLLFIIVLLLFMFLLMIILSL